MCIRDSITTHLPYEYFELPFCDADSDVEPEAENLGQILGGSSMAFSGYRLVFGQDEQCKILCRKKYDNKAIAEIAFVVATGNFIQRIGKNLGVELEG